MKKSIQIGLVAALFLSTTATRANETDLTLKVTGGTEKIIRLSADKAQDIKLLLFGSNEDVLFQENFHSNADAVKKYDLNALPDGNYTLQITSAANLITYNIAIEAGDVMVSTPTVATLFKPLISKENGAIVLNLDNVSKTPIEVDVYNQFNEPVYSEVFKGKLKLQKQFDIRNTDAQSLTFVVKSKDQSFTKTIEVN